MQRHLHGKMMLILVLLALLAAACGNNRTTSGSAKLEPVSKSYFIFDTIVSIRVYDDRMNEEHFDQIKALLHGIDERMNRQLDGSEIDHVNRLAGAEAVKVSEDTFHVLKTALDYARASNGRFDPTIGPLVDLWGIGDEGAAVPAASDLMRTLQLVNYEAVELDEHNRTVKLTKPGMSIDLGAIAKGYAADAVAAYLKQQSFNSAILDLGGNILALGSKPDSSNWSIGIQDPGESRGDHLGILRVTDKTIVTSGVYERFFKEDDQVYHHILSTDNGKPVDNELLSVTIVTDSSMDADAMSTTVFAMGLEDGKRYIEQRGDADAIFVLKDKEVHITSGLQGNFNLSNSSYRLAE